MPAYVVYFSIKFLYETNQLCHILAVCDKACSNGGKCYAPNICSCPQNFKGYQCQFPVENCSPASKLDFNGGYKCTATLTDVKCSIFCDHGIPFEFDAEPFYTCKFETGEFLPKTIPHCKHGA